MTDYKALILDFGGVLTSPMQDAMVAFGEEAGVELQDLARAALGAYTGGEDDLVVAFETGRMPEEEFAVKFAARLSEISGVPVEAAGIVRRIFRLELEEGMFGAVAAAREAGLKTALLSNSWGVAAYPMDRLEELFDAIVISGLVGMRKPDPEIFRYTTDKLGVDAESSIFVDDHPGHLKAAQEEGMTTVLHRTPDQTIRELEQLLGLTLK